jgi:hypothetical protein
MQFRHCGVYHEHFSALVESEEHPMAPLLLPIVGCGRCHQWYFADIPRGPDRAVLDDLLQRAEQHLLRECPDHSHRFEIQRPAPA